MSVAYRFLLASLLVFAWCRMRGLPLAFSLKEHAWLALFGLGTFGVGYVLVYYAEQHVVSGLVAEHAIDARQIGQRGDKRL